MVKIAGRHTLKVGVDARQYRVSWRTTAPPPAASRLLTRTCVRQATASRSVSAAIWRASCWGCRPPSRMTRPPAPTTRSYYYGAFVQDDWRVTDHLTLNLGVRFDKDTPYGEKFGRTVNGFDPTATNAVTLRRRRTYAAHPHHRTFRPAAFNTRGGLTYPGTQRRSAVSGTDQYGQPAVRLLLQPGGVQRQDGHPRRLRPVRDAGYAGQPRRHRYLLVDGDHQPAGLQLDHIAFGQQRTAS